MKEERKIKPQPMIDAKSLRIGNVVTRKSGEIMTILELRQNHARCRYIRSDTGKEYFSLIEYREIEPIPLSEEILIKCGFIPEVNSIMVKFWSIKVSKTMTT